MSLIQHPLAALPGIPLENSFQVLDETGEKCGNAAVVEYINHTMLPDCPLNYYISINARSDRAFDLLLGATLARSMTLRTRKPHLKARVYAPCKPYDQLSLRNFQEAGFLNDDAIIRMRRILSPASRMPNPPVGCVIAPIALENDDDAEGIVRRMNAYSVTERSIDWLAQLRREQMLEVHGVWQDQRLLGEMILSAYGAEGRLEMIYTRPEYRRRGIATALISHAEQVLLRNGIRSLTAEVWRRVVSAMSLFETLGFESVSPTILYPGIDL